MDRHIYRYSQHSNLKGTKKQLNSIIVANNNKLQVLYASYESRKKSYNQYFIMMLRRCLENTILNTEDPSKTRVIKNKNKDRKIVNKKRIQIYILNGNNFHFLLNINENFDHPGKNKMY